MPRFRPREASLALEYVNGLDPKTFAVSIDGHVVEDLGRFRTDIVLFSYEVPEEPNMYTCMGAPGVVGTISPSFSAGYYDVIAPLSTGHHEFKSVLDRPTDDVFISVTYNLTVE